MSAEAGWDGPHVTAPAHYVNTYVQKFALVYAAK